MAEKKKYPFNDRAFQFRLDGNMVAGCKNTPTCCFSPTDVNAKNPAIYFNGYFNHENMDKPFSQQFTFDDFRYVLNVIKAVAYAPGTDKIVKQIACKYYKDREFKHSGVTLGVVRDDKGLIYFAFKNKHIPTIPFPLVPKGSIEQQNKDGEVEDIREVSANAAISWVERNMAMLDRAIENAIEMDTGSNSSSGSSSGSSYGNSSSSSAPSGGNNTAIDFDEDVPF